MTEQQIILIDEHDRHRHVLRLAQVSATAELVADWAEHRDEAVPARPTLTVPTGGGIRLPSLRDFLGSHPTLRP